MTPAISRHFDRDLDRLRSELLLNGVRVEQAIHALIHALSTDDRRLAREILAQDASDEAVSLHEGCLKSLALYHPTATDLRQVILILNAQHGLDVMHALVRRLAERTLEMHESDRALDFSDKLVEASERARTVLRETLQALAKSEPDLARRALRETERLEVLHRSTLRALGSPGRSRISGSHLRWISIAQTLEQITLVAAQTARSLLFHLEGEVLHPGEPQPTRAT